jgi:predicted PurR-regulated permease PerM
LILAGFFVFLASALAALTPILYRELLAFSDELPAYIDNLWALLEPVSQYAQGMMGGDGTSLRDMLSTHAGSAVDLAGQVVQGLAAGGQAAFGALSIVVLMPIVAYFMMKEWNYMTSWVIDLIPKQNKRVIMDLFREIDRKLSGFIRGQVSVALILAVSYALALSFLGLKYGFLIGFSAGLLSIIPMVGSTLGLVVAVLVAWFQVGDWIYVLTIAAVFLVGQLIEGNILTPKLVGKSVGLHPLWVFFALLAGGALFGILGMVLAVPVAAVAGVLIAFAIKQYKSSRIYNPHRKNHAPQGQKKKKKKNV